MSRWQGYLSELQPAHVLRGLARSSRPKSVSSTPGGRRSCRLGRDRGAGPRDRADDADTVRGRSIHQIGLPYHWGSERHHDRDAANELGHLSLDPNVHIQEVKAFAVDIRPGRRPRGPARTEFVLDYQRRAHITAETGTEV